MSFSEYCRTNSIIAVRKIKTVMMRLVEEDKTRTSQFPAPPLGEERRALVVALLSMSTFEHAPIVLMTRTSGLF